MTTTATPSTRRKTTPKAKTSSRAKAPAKRAPKRAKPRAAAKPAPESRPLPARLADVTYVARTRDILAKRQRRAAKLRQDTRRELEGVLKDLRQDALDTVESARSRAVQRAEDAFAKARDTRVGLEVERVANDVTDRANDRVDGWLDQLGLVRKSRLAG